ncbi:hypothetical protein [Mucilaginibacter sp. NFX135]|uniref:hypothetical protein n=1 Tax=Mucilaginibacter sp. NFX135 TaxID=3402687 RepID=UPI003AFA3911
MTGENSLAEKVAAVLSVSLNGRASVTGGDGHVLIALHDDDFKKHFTQIRQQVSLIVDEAFPNRPEDISLLFQNEDGDHQWQFDL